MITCQDKDRESNWFRTRGAVAGALSSNYNADNSMIIMQNLDFFKHLKQCLLIQQIQIKENTLENLTPKLWHQKVAKQNIS